MRILLRWVPDFGLKTLKLYSWLTPPVVNFGLGQLPELKVSETAESIGSSTRLLHFFRSTQKKEYSHCELHTRKSLEKPTTSPRRFQVVDLHKPFIC